MAKISMLIKDDDLAEIDAQAGGNRTAFMVEAALERARHRRRDFEDAEIERLCAENADETLAVYRDWEVTMADGLNDED
jgi:hypothetical protein